MAESEYLAEHTVRCAAPPESVFRLIADVTLWPVLFAPTVHVELLERDTVADVTTERFRLTALVEGQVRSWTSRRRVDAQELRIDFEQEHAAAPFADMGGRWTFLPSDGGTKVVLTHRFRPTEDTPATVAWIHQALDRNSAVELAAVSRAADAPFPFSDLVVACEDSVAVDSAADAYAFINHAERWSAVLPHVHQVRIDTDAAGAQHLGMTVNTPDGSLHTTHSIRLLTAPRRIVYKQTTPPVGLLGHSGEWEFGTDEDGRATATSRHVALLDPTTVATAEELALARVRVTTALSTNSRATLAHAVRPAVGVPGNAT